MRRKRSPSSSAGSNTKQATSRNTLRQLDCDWIGQDKSSSSSSYLPSDYAARPVVVAPVGTNQSARQ